VTEWDASDYARVSGLQQAMAKEVLRLLDVQEGEWILDVGCGNGKITAEIARRVPQGKVVGVDPSAEMIALAAAQFGPAAHPNLQFQVGDARHLAFREEFGLVVSFNALHWIPEQGEALRSLWAAMKPDGRAQLRLVPAGARKSLENVIEETRLSPNWSGYFEHFRDPYLHLTPEQYSELAEQNGFLIRCLHVADKAWNFGSRSAFIEFGLVTFIEWTQKLPEEKRRDFVIDVLDRYADVINEPPGEEKTFKFYQMDITLSRA
jgi:trans-aconitate 2-methyltransferase